MKGGATMNGNLLKGKIREKAKLMSNVQNT